MGLPWRDRCPFIGDFAECPGTTVIEYDLEVYPPPSGYLPPEPVTPKE